MAKTCATNDDAISFRSIGRNIPDTHFPRSVRNFKNNAARTVIEGGKILSVPLEGGSACLKHRNPDLYKIRISDHGRWRQEHLGTINAIYGKSPYFAYIYPEIEKIYLERSHGTIGEFNESLFSFVKNFLDLDGVCVSARQMETSNPGRLAELKNEFATKVNLNNSILEALFRLGKNAAFLFI